MALVAIKRRKQSRRSSLKSLYKWLERGLCQDVEEWGLLWAPSMLLIFNDVLWLGLLLLFPRVQCGLVGSVLACCMAGPSSNPGSAPQGGFSLLSETSNEENGERPRRMDIDDCIAWMWLWKYVKDKINKKSGSCHQTFTLIYWLTWKAWNWSCLAWWGRPAPCWRAWWTPAPCSCTTLVQPTKKRERNFTILPQMRKKINCLRFRNCILKGTVWPDWICMRVVPMNRPWKGLQPL